MLSLLLLLMNKYLVIITSYIYFCHAAVSSELQCIWSGCLRISTIPFKSYFLKKKERKKKKKKINKCIKTRPPR